MVMDPPINKVSSLQMASPRPLPPYRLVVEPSTWVKDSNTDSTASARIPIPVS